METLDSDRLCVIALGHWLANKSAETRHTKNGVNAEAKQKNTKETFCPIQNIKQLSF